MGLEDTIGAARGGEVDLLLENCRVVDVFGGEVLETPVAVCDGLVVGIGEGYAAREVVDLGGRYLAPAFMDGHVHLESSMVSIPQFASTVVPLGTTVAVTDCHEIANVMGVEGIEYMTSSAEGTPLDVFVMLPSCVPATPLETSGAVLEASDLAPLAAMPQVIGLGEMMNFPGVLAGDPGVLAKLRLFPDGPVDGHAPGLTGRDLCAYVAAGVDSEHESTTASEAREKLERGMYIFLREGTGARNLLDLLPVVTPASSRRCCMVTDDRHPDDLLERGHVNSMLEMAVGAGLPAVTAVQMATLNTAMRFGLRGRGAIAPGCRADMVVLPDLERFTPDAVYKDGKRVAEGGELLVDAGASSGVPPSTFNVAGFGPEKLRVEAGGGKARVIELVPEQIVTGALELDVPVVDGAAAADTGNDILKIAVVERHGGTGNVGLGFVRGFGLGRGALASSVAHDSHNIVVVGVSDGDMAAAVAEIVRLQGGQVAVSGGEVVASVALPIAGLMSPLPAGEVAAGVEGLNKAAAGLGCAVQDPFMTMSFLALPVIPELKLTDRGLVDVGKFDFVPLFTG